MKSNRRNQGSAVVFLLLALLPMTIFFFVVLESIRLSGRKGTASDAAALALDGALSTYNRDLKDAYGLYAITDLGAAASFASDSLEVTLHPEKYSSGDGENGLSMEASPKLLVYNDSALSAENVFTSQICDFMKYFSPLIGDEMFYVTFGMEYQKDSVQVILDKCRYDLKLYQLNEGLCEVNAASLSELNRLYQVWKDDVSALHIPDILRNSMRSYLEESPGELGLSDMVQQEEEETPEEEQEEEASEETDAEAGLEGAEEEARRAAEEEEARRLAEENLKTKKEKADRKLRTNLAYLNGASYYQAEVGGQLEDLSPECAPEAVLSVVDDTGNYVAMMEQMLDSLEKIAAVYEHYEDVEKLIQDGCSPECMIAEYAGSMFSCFISHSVSISGHAMNSGKLPGKYAFSEIEYILCGNKDMDANQDIVHCMLLNYCFLCSVMENYSLYTEKVGEAMEQAVDLGGGPSNSTFMLQDLSLMGISCKDAYDTKHNINNEETGVMEFKVFRGDYYLTMDYTHYVNMLLLYYAVEYKDCYLARMQKLIEANMQSYGYSDFSFDRSYTMLKLNVDFTTNAMIFGEVSFSYKGAEGF